MNITSIETGMYYEYKICLFACEYICNATCYRVNLVSRNMVVPLSRKEHVQTAVCTYMVHKQL